MEKNNKWRKSVLCTKTFKDNKNEKKKMPSNTIQQNRIVYDINSHSVCVCICWNRFHLSFAPKTHEWSEKKMNFLKIKKNRKPLFPFNVYLLHVRARSRAPALICISKSECDKLGTRYLWQHPNINKPKHQDKS